eukprot:gene27211-27452_t
MHGPWELMEEGFPVLVLSPDDAARANTAEAVAKMRAAGADVRVVGGGLPFAPSGHPLLDPLSMIQTGYLEIEMLARDGDTVMAYALTGARIFTGEHWLGDHAVIIDGAHIADVVPRAETAAHELRDLGGGLLAPGFIDVQVNGGGGALLNGNPSVETVRTIARAHRRFGTVGLLPTVITDAPVVISSAVESVSRAMAEGEPGVLGIHIEGPFLDVARKGAHAARFIREMEEKDADEIIRFAARCPVMLTLAPNR